MACYAMHTNYDVKRMGKIAAERMGIRSYEILEATSEDGAEGIGFTADLPEAVSLGEYGRKIKAWFHIPEIRIYGDPEQKIDRISVCPGSAKGMEDFARAQGGQVLIGGDFGHHEGLDCLEKQIAVDRRRSLWNRTYFYRRYDSISETVLSGCSGVSGADRISVSINLKSGVIL